MDLGVTVRDGAGAAVTEPVVAWSVLPPDAGMVASDGRLVAYVAGPLRVVAAAGALADTASIAVTARGLSSSFGVVGHGSAGSHTTTDLWVYGDAGYTGTITSPAGVPGNTLLVWNLAGADPVLSDSVRVSAATVNDVKVPQDGALAVVGVFAAPPGEQWHGVHNLWIEGDYVPAIAATGDRRPWVVDISDPANPVRVTVP